MLSDWKCLDQIETIIDQYHSGELGPNAYEALLKIETILVDFGYLGKTQECKYVEELGWL
jgi:hypothetical protein